MWFAIARGVRGCSLVCVRKPALKMLDSDDFRCHWLTRIRNYIYVDWTARQFWPDSPYPLVVDSAELRDYWID